MKAPLLLLFLTWFSYSVNGQAEKAIFVRTAISFSPTPVLTYADPKGFELTSVDNRPGYEFAIRLDNNQNLKWSLFKQIKLGYHRYWLEYNYDPSFVEAPFDLSNQYFVFKDITYFGLDLGLNWSTFSTNTFTLNTYLTPSAVFGFRRPLTFGFSVPDTSNPSATNTLLSQRRTTYPNNIFLGLNFGVIAKFKIKNIRTTFESFVSWSNAKSLMVETEIIGKDRTIFGTTSKNHQYFGVGIGFCITDIL